MDAVGLIAPVARPAARASVLPGGLLLIVALFILVQNRIDRHDPKLASAPVNVPDSEFTERERWS
jgi:nitrate reductase gamma subunit